jgi:hypothetical protein
MGVVGSGLPHRCARKPRRCFVARDVNRRVSRSKGVAIDLRRAVCLRRVFFDLSRRPGESDGISRHPGASRDG